MAGVRVGRFHPNPIGINALTKTSDMADGVDATSEVVAENVRRQGIYVEHEPGDIALPVEVDAYDAAASTGGVRIAHPAGEAVQAKHGALTKAAAEAGLQVKGGS
jgi:hypothetical protein